MPALILAGEEEYNISKRVRALKEKLVDPAWASFNYARLDNPDLKQVVEAAATVPFGPGNKMILIDNCSLFTKKRSSSGDSDGTKDKGSAKIVEDFESSLSTISPNTHLVFACPHNFDKSLKVSKAAEKHATIETFEKVKYYAGAANNELLNFCNKEAHVFGAVIDDDAAFYLAESTEVDLRLISKEMEKVATYIMPEKQIKLEHVTLLSPHFSHVFALMEYWALNQKQKVLESIYELQSRMVSAHMVVAAAQTVLTKWVFYKTEYERAATATGGGREAKRRDVPFKDVAYKIDQRTAFMIEKDLRRIKDLQLDYLIDKKRQLTDLEQLVKTGQMPESHALEMFFTR